MANRPYDRDRHASILKEHILRPYDKGDFTTEPWRSLPEIPSSAEILGTDETGDLVQQDQLYGVSRETRPDLPVNLVDQPWSDSASYIGAHYQLLREDAVYPLRKAVAEVKANPMMKDTINTAIYTHVHIIGITLSSHGLGMKVEFSYENAGKRIRWEHSSRLQQGTIVALTPRGDMFRTICKIAVVAARPLADGVELNPPRVDLFWGSSDEAEFDPTINWIMVESRSGYWESFRHMGVALQKLRSESFPLSKHLVDLEKNIGAPDHITRNPYTDMTSLLPNAPVSAAFRVDADSEFENVNILLESWPEIPSSLDASQMEATNRILTKQIAIVQGPPGTGKTFVSITSLKIMLDKWVSGDPPIIISAQTNHALDQLLLLIEPYAPDFIRLGGRTADRSGVIKKRTLFEVRASQGRGQGSSAGNVRNAMERIRAMITGNLKLLLNDEALTGQDLLALDLITQEQFDSLHKNTWKMAHDPNAPVDVPQSDIFTWVGSEQMSSSENRCPPINISSFEEEELDDQYEILNEEEAESGSKNDDEIEALKGSFHPLKQTWSGRFVGSKWSPRKALEHLRSTSDLWNIPANIRGEIYMYFIREAKKKIRRQFRDHCKEYMRCVANGKISNWERDARLITRLKTKIIGCTTTGLSKYRGLLAALQPHILLIEEAAETVEGTVLAAIFESLDQLILVGDHQQLQAKPNRDELSRHPYNLAVSMFERLVKNGLEHTMLNKQRRMIPQIRETFSHVYDGLSDHASVLDRRVNRPPVPGMAHDLFFFTHVWPESRMDTSKCNYDEADMVVNFFSYLVWNGTDASNITILTFYNGQKKVLLKSLRSEKNLQGTPNFKVFTVDSYQGEENDIILLSLVRSNDYQDNGFLAVQNRAVVSLSRARRGLYVFGNSLNVMANSKQLCAQVWGPIIAVFRNYDVASEQLPLTCKNHNETVYVEEASDFQRMELVGGCQQRCGGKLPCGHDCHHNCHPFPHSRIICKEACTKMLPCGHYCNENCGDICCCSLCLPDEEHQHYFPGDEQTEWASGPGSHRLMLEDTSTIPIPGPTNLSRCGNTANLHSRSVARRSTRNRRHGNFSMSTPIPHPSSRSLSGSSSSLPLVRGHHDNSFPPSSWTVWNAQESDRLMANNRRANIATVEDDPSIATTPVIVDNFRQVTFNSSNERGGPRKSVKKEFSQRGPTARASGLDRSESTSAGVAMADMRAIMEAATGGRRTSPLFPNHPPISCQYQNSYTSPGGIENLSLVGGTRQEHVRSRINASSHLLDDSIAFDFGNPGNATQAGVMGSLTHPLVPFRHQPSGSTTNDVDTEEENLIDL